MFEVGDVVVCVDDSPPKSIFPMPKGLRRGSVHRIVGFPHRNGVILDNVVSYNPCGIDASRFRKLPPAEPEFISLIRSLGAPKRVREDA